MSRTNLSLTDLTSISLTGQSWTAIDKTNGMSFDPEGRSEDVILDIYCTAASGGSTTVSLVSGDLPAAFRSALGDLTLSLSGGSVRDLIGGVESARFIQDDGKVLLDFGDAVSGSIAAYRMP